MKFKVALIFICCVLAFSSVGIIKPVYGRSDDIQKAQKQIDDLRQIVLNMKKEKGQGEPKELQWNRYTTTNFEILSLDDAQGRYLSDNIEHIKTWVLWRWGMKDNNFPSKCKVICVPAADLYEKLFNKKTSAWKVDKDGYTVWIMTDGQKWNTRLPVQLTEVVIANMEAAYGTKMPVWVHRGMSVLNGRIEDIRAALPAASGFSSSSLLSMTHDAYSKLSDPQKAGFDAQAAFFCLWVRQEYNGKVFLDFLGGSVINPEQSLQYFGLTSFAECDARVRAYLDKLPSGSDYYFTW